MLYNHIVLLETDMGFAVLTRSTFSVGNDNDSWSRVSAAYRPGFLSSWNDCQASTNGSVHGRYRYPTRASDKH